MATNKEQIQLLEAGLGGVQDSMQRIEDSMTDRLHSLEETINKLLNAILASKVSLSHHNNDWDGFSHTHRDETDSGRYKTDNKGGRHVFSSKMAKLEFSRYYGDDPTEWFNRVDQFFEYQETADNQKGVIGFIPSRRRSQSMVTMVTSSLQRGRANCNMGDI